MLEFHLLQLNGVREHDNHTTLATVNHLPEVSCGGPHRPLSDDECSLLLVSLHTRAHTRTHTHTHTHTHNTHIHTHTRTHTTHNTHTHAHTHTHNTHTHAHTHTHTHAHTQHTTHTHTTHTHTHNTHTHTHTHRAESHSLEVYTPRFTYVDTGSVYVVRIFSFQDHPPLVHCEFGNNTHFHHLNKLKKTCIYENGDLARNLLIYSWPNCCLLQTTLPLLHLC